MLRALDIRDMLIIDRLELDFQPGLNVLTGETGAGKSILLDSLGFVLGWRGRAELVRAGARQGEVTAVFELAPDHPARRVLAEAGIEAEAELILRRVNTESGRKTAWVNDRRVSGEVLRALSDELLELHGQHDDRGLLDPRGHRLMLDEFAQAGPAIARTRAAWAARREARKALGVAQEQIAALRAEEDYLRHAVAELDGLDPQPGEEAELDATRRRMQGAERVRGDIARAHQVISGGGGRGARRRCHALARRRGRGGGRPARSGDGGADPRARRAGRSRRRCARCARRHGGRPPCARSGGRAALCPARSRAQARRDGRRAGRVRRSAAASAAGARCLRGRHGRSRGGGAAGGCRL
ncbi:DNA repair protein RecN [Limimaricola hongkongensis DSM 17492]|uniref:DNA repair protein RecN n=1 Tax=Limimaricola hongkongensis DSM 17492 TaxID=1122180 RepID=A0A017HAQ8_9RHOB|nr:DNA repair protein RecN [Limimaricola hongkongensis DSM 17492]